MVCVVSACHPTSKGVREKQHCLTSEFFLEFLSKEGRRGKKYTCMIFHDIFDFIWLMVVLSDISVLTMGQHKASFFQRLEWIIPIEFSFNWSLIPVNKPLDSFRLLRNIQHCSIMNQYSAAWVLTYRCVVVRKERDTPFQKWTSWPVINTVERFASNYMYLLVTSYSTSFLF